VNAPSALPEWMKVEQWQQLTPHGNSSANLCDEAQVCADHSAADAMEFATTDMLQ